MTKFVAAVIGVAFTIVFSSSALAGGWKIGNWEPPTKAPVLKAVSLNADWGTPAVAVAPVVTVATAGCSGAARIESVPLAIMYVMEARERATCNGRGGGWFLGKRIMANRRARAQARADARMARVHLALLDTATDHS